MRDLLRSGLHLAFVSADLTKSTEEPGCSQARGALCPGGEEYWLTCSFIASSLGGSYDRERSRWVWWDPHNPRRCVWSGGKGLTPGCVGSCKGGRGSHGHTLCVFLPLGLAESNRSRSRRCPAQTCPAQPRPGSPRQGLVLARLHWTWDGVRKFLWSICLQVTEGEWFL